MCLWHATSKQPTHGQQPASISGLSVAFSSPVKHSEKRKTTAYVLPLGWDTKRHCLQGKLHLLQSGQSAVLNPGSHLCPDNSNATLDVLIPLDQLPDLPDDPLPLDLPKTWHILHDKSTYSLYAKWSQVIPTLTQPFLSYIATSTGTATQPLSSLQSKCMAECFRKSCTILGLFKIVSHRHSILWPLFNIRSPRLPEIWGFLLRLPRYAACSSHEWSIPHCTYLPLYGCLCTPSWLLSSTFQMVLWCCQCNGKCAEHILHTERVHTPQQEGSSIKSWVISMRLISNNNSGCISLGLGYTIQWYNILQVHIEWQVESALQLLDMRIWEYQKGQSAELSTNQLAQSNLTTPSFPPQPTVQTAMGNLTWGECARLLQLALQGLCMDDHLYSKAIPQKNSMLHTYLFL